MARPLLLDLFCKAGGAAKGYWLAGFDVIGVDIEPQKRYPFEMVVADALQPPFDLSGFDAIHASPPCQAYSRSRNNGCHKGSVKLIPQVREMLSATGRPYVIENVVGSDLRDPLELCGASFGLHTGQFDLARHRLFEVSFLILGPPCQHRRGKTIGVYGNGTNAWHRKKFGRNITDAEKKEAMGIDWMTRKELTQAIPPAYTEFIGKHLLHRIIEADQRKT